MTEAANCEYLTVDPVKEGIVNRIFAGTRQRGDLHCAGGLWVDGTVEGNIEVDGMLVVSESGLLRGNVRVNGRAVLAGRIEPLEGAEYAELEVVGVAQLASTMVAKANVTAAAFHNFEGAQFDGRIRTYKKGERMEASPEVRAA